VFASRSEIGDQGFAMPKHHHILNASSNLLGIALIIITGLNVAHIAKETFADEIGWVAAVCFSLSCLLSYMAIRVEPRETGYGDWADKIFFAGLVTLMLSVVVFAIHMG
jgi:uncharacterized membrane protein